jgi:cellulose synthase/poly-beta-1,6-N-acetylglucosamine synthase-like glycosyltransferase
MMPDQILSSVDFLLSLEPVKALRIFWFFFVLDFPRYILTDLYLVFLEFQERRYRRNSAFLQHLRNSPPKVSVIIPAMNEERTIGWTIRSLQEQTYGNLEIIVVDDGSSDHTPRICRDLQKRSNIVYRRFGERAGKSAVLNYGLRFASGEYVVFVDSDTTFDRDAIFNLMTTFADPRVGGVSGNLRPRNGGCNLLTALQQIEYMFTISIGRRIRTRFGILPIISGAFGGFRRELIGLRTMGGHEPGPGNDSDLAIRVRKQGYKIAFQPNAWCLTNVPSRIGKLVKQRARWDRNMIKNRLRKHKDVFDPFSRNFRLIDAITFFDSLFFHLGLASVTVFYVVDLLINYREYMLPVLFLNFCLYFLAELFELVAATALSGRPADVRLFVYLPLMNPFKLFLKFVRLFAYLQEFFLRYSMRDPFAPLKVRQRLIEW